MILIELVLRYVYKAHLLRAILRVTKHRTFEPAGRDSIRPLPPLQDMEAQLRVSEDRVATVSSSCEQRLELMRDQSQQLLEQTRIQASQSLLELTAERQRTEALSEELQGSARRLDVAGGEVEEAEDLLRLSREEAEMDAVHSREALEAQQRLYEEHCSQIRQELWKWETRLKALGNR